MSTPPPGQFNSMSPSASNHGRAAAVADLYVLQGEASSSVEKIALKFGETFMVLDARGDLPESEQETGLYWRGARFLRSFDLFLDGKPMTGLSHSVSDEEGSCQIDLTNPFLPRDDPEGNTLGAALDESDGMPGVAQGIPHGVAHVRRRLTLRGRILTEHITLTNYNETPISLTLGVLAGADYRDIFEIRGLHCSQHGRLADPRLAVGEMTLSYLGADKVERETRIEF
ncbi:MAG TPA: glycogen debranching N-terminal domain-containing protein, partial [Ktedonobacterales bacterium]